MAQVQANGIAIEAETFGAEEAPAVLLIMGLGAQLTRWPMPMVDQMVERGYRVIRFDNRDIGLSQKFDAAGVPDLSQVVGAMMRGETPTTPYTLTDMADDAAGVLEAFGIAQAHVIGASMGGMIAQLVAAGHPDRVLSLTSIMSTTGNPALPRATEEAMAVLLTRPAGLDEESIVAHGVRSAGVVGSPAYPVDPQVLAERVRSDFRRSHAPTGFARQMAAITADGDRRERLKRIAAPTVVIHGAADPLVPVQGGRDTAAAIPGARLKEVAGMGHDLPEALIPEILDAFEEVARAAEVAA